MQEGLYNKYVLAKANGNPIDEEARYFVLRYDSDYHAQKALLTYAVSVMRSNPELSKDLQDEFIKYSSNGKDPFQEGLDEEETTARMTAQVVDLTWLEKADALVSSMDYPDRFGGYSIVAFDVKTLKELIRLATKALEQGQ